MKIIITGGTGFIGKILSKSLLESGYKVVILTRNPSIPNNSENPGLTYCNWDGKSSHGWQQHCSGNYAIINLAGENIGKGRWTNKRKITILNSRIQSGRAVAEAVRNATIKPEVVIQASAIGYYEAYNGHISDENSKSGKRFLSDVVRQWEKSVSQVQESGTRFIIARTGVVIGYGGGLLSQLILPFKLFLGGPVGSGLQWLSWIHIEDEVRAFIYLIENKHTEGIYNLCVPEPSQMKDFLKTLAKVLKRPYWLPVPAFLIKIIFGEMGRELILSGERVSGKKIAASGFQFKYKDLYPALKQIISENLNR